MSLHTGQMVTPALRLVSILRRGGMGSIWVAERLPLKAQVAVKFMSPELAEDPGYVERFRREAVAAAQISSPHVAQVLDHGLTADGMPYIAMELLRGEDLRARIRRLGTLPLGEVARIVTQAAKALGQAHRLGIVHRDIKPDNLFLLEVDGETFVKVLDFGIARRARDMRVTSTGNVVGTPLYMSPEQLISAKDLDFRADLWSLGVVAYHAMTGQVPFAGETLVALTLRVFNGAFTPPSALRPEVPPAVDAWMKRALQQDPSARFASAREMADALERALSRKRGADTGAPELQTAPPVEPSLARTRVASAPDTATQAPRPAPAPAPIALSNTNACAALAHAALARAANARAANARAANAGANEEVAADEIAVEEVVVEEVERTTTVMTTTSSRKGFRKSSARLASVAALGALLAGAGLFLGLRPAVPSADGVALAAAPRLAGLPAPTEATLLASVVDAPRPIVPPEPQEPARTAATQPESAPPTEKTLPPPPGPTKQSARPVRTPGRGKAAPPAKKPTRRVRFYPRHGIVMQR